MPVRLSPRRYWPWVAAVAVVLALPAAWPYRPLNRTERGLLGTWFVSHSVGPHLSTHVAVLTPDRRFRIHLVVGTPGESSGQVWVGQWTATSTTFTFDHDNERKRLAKRPFLQKLRDFVSLNHYAGDLTLTIDSLGERTTQMTHPRNDGVDQWSRIDD